MEILYFYFSLIIGIYSFFLFSFKHPHLVQLSLPSFPYFPSSPLFSLSTPRSFPLSCPFPLTSLPFPCPTFSPVASFPPFFIFHLSPFPFHPPPFFPISPSIYSLLFGTRPNRHTHPAQTVIALSTPRYKRSSCRITASSKNIAILFQNPINYNSPQGAPRPPAFQYIHTLA